LTQRQLATKVGVSPSYVSKIEHGVVATPSASTILKFASILKADANEFLRIASKFAPVMSQKSREHTILEFGSKLSELRKKTGLSQLEFARKTNVDPSYISKLERAKMPPPSRKILHLMAKALEVSKNELITISGRAPCMAEGKREVRQMFRDTYRSVKRNVRIPNLSSLTNKGWVRVATSILLATIISGGLWIASPSPAEAVTVSFPSTPAATQSSSHSFTVRVDITGATDLLPVQSIDLWVEDQTGAYSYTLTGIPLTATTTTFSPSGVGTVSVTATPGSNWSYATSLATTHYGYGYGYTTNEWGPETYGTGYGYGYSTGGTGDTYIVFTVTWTPPATWPTGTYSTNAIVHGSGSPTASLTGPTPGSFTVSAAAVVGPSGPSEPPVGEPLVTNVGVVTDTSGTFTEPVTINSRDDNVSIDIAEGTVGLGENGRPLAEITVTRVEDPPPPPAGTNVIGVPYDFGPDGATFDPPITMTFSYRLNQLPAGADAGDLSIAYYDQDRGEWVELAAGDITVDPVTGTITARVSHFTQFSVIVHSAPAEFVVSGLVYPTTSIGIAEQATISAFVANIGDVAGTTTVTLKINGVAVASESLKLDGGESRKVSFTTVQGQAGDYKVEIAGLSGTFTVKAASVGPVVITSAVPSVTAPAVQPSTPTAPAVPAAPAPVPAPTPWTAIIIVLVISVIVGGILVWNYGFRRT